MRRPTEPKGWSNTGHSKPKLFPQESQGHPEEPLCAFGWLPSLGDHSSGSFPDCDGLLQLLQRCSWGQESKALPATCPGGFLFSPVKAALTLLVFSFSHQLRGLALQVRR